MRHIVALVFAVMITTGLLEAGEQGGSRRPGSNSGISMYIETGRGVPQYVAGRLSESVSRGSEVSAALSYFEDHKGTYKMSNPREEIIADRVDRDRSNNQHARFDQHYKGVRVIGGELVSHFNENNELKVVNGYYHYGIDLDVAPRISSQRAIDISLADLAGVSGAASAQQPELVIFPWQDEYLLCWRLFLISDHPIGRWEYYVDAKSGEVVYSANLIKRSDEVGTGHNVLGQPRNHIDVWFTGSTYELRDNTRRLNNNIHGHNGQMPDDSHIQTNIAGYDLPGPIATDPDNVWGDVSAQAPAVDAHVYAGLFYDWALTKFGRNSYDNNGATMLSSVNCLLDQNTAWWTGTQVVYMTWQTYTRSFAACLDVVGHEWGHGITEYCSDLVYRWESGAVDEAFSDMIGTAFEFAHDTLDIPDWNIGENAFVFGNGYESLSDPEIYGQPSTYKGPNWYETDDCIPSFANDFCGVHRNNGVGNKWFYLLSAGGIHNGVTVNGIDIENAIQVAYQANAYYWTSTSDYLDAAIGTYYAAMDLDPTGVWAEQVLNAWLAVGIDIPGTGLSFEYPLGSPRTIQTGQATLVEVEVSGVMNGVPDPGTGQIHYSIDGGDLITEPMVQVDDNYYQAYLPPLSCEQILNYYFSARESGGERFYHPDPTSPFSPVVVDSTPAIFEDNFETDLGWEIYGNATDGHWERGVPIGDGGEGVPEMDYDGSGQCFLTDNAAGDSDVDDGSTNLVSPPFDLDGVDGMIRFATWYNVRCAPGPGEVMNIYISNDDGNSWTLLKFLGPQLDAHGGWIEHEFVVSDFVTPTSLLRLRFDACDIGWPSCVEAAVDAVEVTRFVCEAYVCGDANNDTSINLLDVTFIVNYLYKDGAAPESEWAADANGDESLNILDVTYIVNFLYKDGPPPDCP